MSDPTRPPLSQAVDPRMERAAAGPPPWGGDPRPMVASGPRGRDSWLIISVAVLFGVLVLLWMGLHRASGPRAQVAPALDGAVVAAPSVPPDVAAFQADGRQGAASTMVSNASTMTPATLAAGSATTSPQAAPLAGANGVIEASLKAPAVVVDLAEPPPTPSGGPGKGQPAGADTHAGGPSGGQGPSGLNGDEQFAARVGAEQPDRAEATVLHNLSQTVPQGAMIPGVLETALDSDLPGYARAVVSREVRSFDGSTVLIPRGSRVIGQYKSAVAQGQSRAFVIWTRILRPDGVSIQIGSSGTDPLGRAGLAGTVNRHFLEQFGGAILLSVINAGITSLVRQPSTEVVIGSAQQATTLAGSAALPTSISPTIKVPQGTPIRIFVARDLDFSSAQGANP